MIDRSRIISIGMTKLGKLGLSATQLMHEAFKKTMENDYQTLNPLPIRQEEIDGLIAIPSLSESHFMMAHYFATKYGIFDERNSKDKLSLAKTIDLGGAGPISALIHADRLIKSKACNVVAIVAGDAIGSMSSAEFLKAADDSCIIQKEGSKLPSPIIPNGYNKVAEWYVNKGMVTREQLGMVSVLMSINAVNHPNALSKKVRNLSEVLNSQRVSTMTGLYECAHRSDGAAAILVASENYLKEMGYDYEFAPFISCGSEASGPIFPPDEIQDYTYNSCIQSVERIYKMSGLTVDDIDYFGLYDCFPICFVRAAQAVGLHRKKSLWTKEMLKDESIVKNAGNWIEGMYKLSEQQGKFLHPFQFPVNTHGGLLCFGAPWEVPALFNVIESVKQLRGIAKRRQIPNVKRALVYGNGGILSASSIVLLESGNSTNI